jgi:adenylosuccinate lyase
VSWASLARGLGRIEADEFAMRTDLEGHWELVTEGAQTILRAAGVHEAYDRLKSIVRGKRLTEGMFDRWVEDLPCDKFVKEKLRALSPMTYIGLAEQLTERALTEE